MRNLKPIAGAIAFMVLWGGAALAMPTAFFAPDEEPAVVTGEVDETLDFGSGALDPTTDNQTGTASVPDEDEEDGEDGEDGESGDAESEAGPNNHGMAVSTAARCSLKGRAKGELVSSVARDKGATAESAQAACDAALAAAATGATATKVKPAKPEKPARAPKPEKATRAETAPKPEKAPKPEPDAAPEAEPDDEASSSNDSGPPAGAGPPTDKGSKKP